MQSLQAFPLCSEQSAIKGTKTDKKNWAFQNLMKLNPNPCLRCNAGPAPSDITRWYDLTELNRIWSHKIHKKSRNS